MCPGRRRHLRVSAAILEKDGRFLVAKRKEGDRFAGLWEFPGGKQEPGESPEDCLRRELAEEFGVETEVGEFLGAVSYESAAFSLELRAYAVKHLTGTYKLRDHEEIRWVLSSDLARLPLTEPDRKLVARLRKKGFFLAR